MSAEGRDRLHQLWVRGSDALEPIYATSGAALEAEWKEGVALLGAEGRRDYDVAHDERVQGDNFATRLVRASGEGRGRLARR